LENQVTKEYKYSAWMAFLSPINQFLPKKIQYLLFSKQIHSPLRFCSLLAYIGLYKIGVIDEAEYNKDLLKDPVELSELSCFKKPIKINN